MDSVSGLKAMYPEQYATWKRYLTDCKSQNGKHLAMAMFMFGSFPCWMK
jgi:hypothetical protein